MPNNLQSSNDTGLIAPFVGGELPRDLIADAPDLRVSHVVKAGVHFYLLVNEGGKAIDARVTVPVSGRAQWWNAWDGTIADAPTADGAYPVHLGMRESLILCIDPAQEAVCVPAEAPVQPVKVRPAQWTLTREDGATAVLVPDADGHLPGWETLPGWECFSGVVAYEAAVDFAPGAVIDLGEVHEIARVFADGKPIGTRLWGPYVFRLPEGAKVLRAEIANTPAGKMDGVSLPSGLMG